MLTGNMPSHCQQHIHVSALTREPAVHCRQHGAERALPEARPRVVSGPHKVGVGEEQLHRLRACRGKRAHMQWLIRVQVGGGCCSAEPAELCQQLLLCYCTAHLAEHSVSSSHVASY